MKMCGIERYLGVIEPLVLLNSSRRNSHTCAADLRRKSYYFFISKNRNDFSLVSIFCGMPDVSRLAIRRVVHHVHNVPDVAQFVIRPNL